MYRAIIHGGTETKEQFFGRGRMQTEAPGPPARPTAALDGARRVLLSWEPPASSGSSSVESYVVFGRSGGESSAFKQLATTGTPATVIRDISPGWWEFRVSATNASSRGPHSQPSEPLSVAEAALPSMPSTVRPAASRRSGGGASHSSHVGDAGRKTEDGTSGSFWGQRHDSRWLRQQAAVPTGGKTGSDASWSGFSLAQLCQLAGTAAATLTRLLSTPPGEAGREEKKSASTPLPSAPSEFGAEYTHAAVLPFSLAAVSGVPCELPELLDDLVRVACQSNRFPMRSVLAEGGVTHEGSADFEWPVAGYGFVITNSLGRREVIPMDIPALVDMYNRWVGSEVLPQSLKRYEFVPAVQLHVPPHHTAAVGAAAAGAAAASAGAGAGGPPTSQRWSGWDGEWYSLTLQTTPARIARERSAAAGSHAADPTQTTAHAASRTATTAPPRNGATPAVTAAAAAGPFERMLCSTEVMLAVTLRVRPVGTEYFELQMGTHTTWRADVPQPWYAPQFVSRGAGNLLLKLALKLGVDALLREFQWLLQQWEWTDLQRRKHQPDPSSWDWRKGSFGL